jgi:hypothetical protein
LCQHGGTRGSPVDPLLDRAIASDCTAKPSKAGFASAASSCASSGKTAPEPGLVDEVDERTLAVDLDDGQPLPVPRLELGIAGDVDFLQLDIAVRRHGDECLARALAQVAARRVVEDDLGYGYRPLVVVASATRMTAQP